MVGSLTETTMGSLFEGGLFTNTGADMDGIYRYTCSASGSRTRVRSRGSC